MSRDVEWLIIEREFLVDNKPIGEGPAEYFQL